MCPWDGTAWGSTRNYYILPQIQKSSTQAIPRTCRAHSLLQKDHSWSLETYPVQLKRVAWRFKQPHQQRSTYTVVQYRYLSEKEAQLERKSTSGRQSLPCALADVSNTPRASTKRPRDPTSQTCDPYPQTTQEGRCSNGTLNPSAALTRPASGTALVPGQRRETPGRHSADSPPTPSHNDVLLPHVRSALGDSGAAAVPLQLNDSLEICPPPDVPRTSTTSDGDDFLRTRSSMQMSNVPSSGMVWSCAVSCMRTLSDMSSGSGRLLPRALSPFRVRNTISPIHAPVPYLEDRVAEDPLWLSSAACLPPAAYAMAACGSPRPAPLPRAAGPAGPRVCAEDENAAGHVCGPRQAAYPRKRAVLGMLSTNVALR